MAPCSNHAPSKKGTCHSCGFCKLCPPLTDGSCCCKTPDDHIQPGKQNKDKQQNPPQTSNIAGAATPSRASRNAEVNDISIESFDDEKSLLPSLNRTMAYPNSSHESRQIHDKVPTASSSISSLSPKRKLVDICTTLGLMSGTLRHDLEAMATESDGFNPKHIGGADRGISPTHRRAKRIRTCIVEAIDELIFCPQEPRACASNTQLAQRPSSVKDLSLDDDELDNRKKIAVVESNASNTTSMATKSTFETTCANDDDAKCYPVQCHCGRIKAIVQCSSTNIVAWDCNCSDCHQRKNIHFVVPANKLCLSEEMTESLQDATILYTWGTKTAQRRFCKTCGILPFYTPRSNASDGGYGVTLACVDFGTNGPQVEIRKFDGVNWEKSFRETSIANESK
jgi:hypothetical protein